MILPNEKKYQHIAVFSHGAWIHSLLTYIYQREIKEYCMRQDRKTVV